MPMLQGIELAETQIREINTQYISDTCLEVLVEVPVESGSLSTTGVLKAVSSFPSLILEAIVKEANDRNVSRRFLSAENTKAVCNSRT